MTTMRSDSTSEHSGKDDAACGSWDYSECQGTEYCPPRCPRFIDENNIALLIEPYESGHHESLLAMYDDFDRSDRTLGLPPFSDERRREWTDHLTSNGWNLVAVHDDTVVGHVAAVPVEDGDVQFLVFVHQDYQNRGLGTELLKQLMAYADERGHEALTLSVALENRRAIHVYDNLGFDVVERLESELSMRLSLDEPIVERAQLPPAERT